MAAGYRAEPAGINSEGMRRRGFNAAQINNVKKIYKILYRQNLSYEQARNHILTLTSTAPELKTFADFFAISHRGIIR